LKNDNRRYALRYAAIYTLLTASILISPLLVYVSYMQNIEGIKQEIELKEHARTVIRSMERYDQNAGEYFHFPRFQSFQAGLYNARFEPVFTLIEQPLEHFDLGYHRSNTSAYIIQKLPPERYFGATYLIVATTHTDSEVLRTAAIILLGIVIIVFAVSFFFLNDFARPFKRVNRMLDNFIKDSMHEINTPLSIININADLIGRKVGASKYLDRIKSAAKSLATIYDDMDYLIKRDRIDYPPEPVDLSAFLHERVDYFRSVGQMKNLAIHAHIQPGIVITFNPTQLQRIIDNNLSNAIKYSYENNRIDIYLHRMQGGQIIMRFQDHGVGIEHPEKIFERYYRENEDKGGFGIGLNIVKKIIDDAGIQLSIASQPKRGSTFSYFFPSHYLLETPSKNPEEI